MKWNYIWLFFVVISSCTTGESKNYENSSVLGFDLINKCVDTVLKANEDINTANYVVDLSAIRNLNKKGQDSFTSYKAAKLPTSHQDSVIIYDDPSWETFHVSKSMIIKFDSIQTTEKNLVNVKVRKIRAHDKISTLSLFLKQRKGRFVFVKGPAD